MNERPTGPTLTEWNRDGDPSQEAIALLQEEIAHLEAELQARDEASLLSDADARASGPGPHEGALQRRLDDLTSELASRDETVNLLLEQTRLFEEAAVAQRAEWEQLSQWVDEVERRVEGRDESVDTLRGDLEAERVRGESLRREAEADRREWETRRRGLEREAEHLRGLVAAAAAGGRLNEEAGAALIAVEDENRRLRQACSELGRIAAAAADAEELHHNLAAAEAELEQARSALRAVDDDRRRERKEFEAEVVALRSRLARESLQAPPQEAAPERPAELDADERIRAFRQHLKELHEREAEERAKSTFAARLSRLWRSTGPG